MLPFCGEARHKRRRAARDTSSPSPSAPFRWFEEPLYLKIRETTISYHNTTPFRPHYTYIHGKMTRIVNNPTLAEIPKWNSLKQPLEIIT
jgi:hypothetical protein